MVLDAPCKKNELRLASIEEAAIISLNKTFFNESNVYFALFLSYVFGQLCFTISHVFFGYLVLLNHFLCVFFCNICSLFASMNVVVLIVLQFPLQPWLLSFSLCSFSRHFPYHFCNISSVCTIKYGDIIHINLSKCNKANRLEIFKSLMCK